MAETDGSIRIDTALDSSGFEHGSDDMRRALSSVEQAAEDAGARIQSAVQEGFEGVNVSGLTESMTQADLAIAKAELRLEKAQAALEAFVASSIPTDEYKKLASDIDRAESALLKLYDRRDIMQDMGVDESSAQWRRLEIQIGNAESKLEALESDAAAMREAGTAMVDPQATIRFQELSLAVDEARLKLLNLRNAQDANATAPEPVKPGFFDTLIAKARAAKMAATETAKSWAKLAASKIKAGIGKIAAKIKDVGSHSKNSALSANKLVKALGSLKNMIVSRVKRAFTSYLFEEMQTSLKDLAKFDGAYNQSMSNMRNRTTELSANIASSIGTIIKAVEPYITAMIDAASNAMAKVSAILAKLTGSKTVAVAAKQTTSYADTLDGTANSANKAAAAQKKLNATLSSYDQLHKLNDNSETGSDTSESDTNRFQNANVEYVLSDVPDLSGIAGKIRESIMAGDWAGTGAAVGDELNLIVSSIDAAITRITPKAEQWVHNAAEVLNGFVKQFDGVKFGTTIANAINLGIAVADKFLTTFDFGALGTKVGTALSTAFTNINWAWLGHALSEGIKGAFRFLTNAITAIDWRQVGVKIQAFIASIDWAGITAELFRLIGAAIGAAVMLLGGLFSGIPEKIQKFFEEEFARMDTGSIGLDIILGILVGIGDAVIGIGKWLWENVCLPFVEGFKEAFGIASPSKVMAEQGGFIIEGLFNGIKEAWTTLTSWISGTVGTIKDIFGKAWDKLKSSTSEKWESIKGKITSAVTNIRTTATGKINSLKGDILQRWDQVNKSTAEKWNTIKNTLTGKLSDMTSKAVGKFTELKNSLAGKFDEIKNKLKSFSFIEVGENILNGIKDGVKNAWENVKNAATGAFEGIINLGKKIFQINSPSKVFEQIGDYTMQGLAQGIEAGESDALKSASRAALEITDRMRMGVESAPSLEVTEAGLVRHLDHITEKLLSVARAFEAIGSAITAMGGLPVPQMATGAILPPRTRVSDNRDREDNDEVVKLLTKIIALLGDNNPRGGGSTRIPIEVVSKIDKRELARAVAEVEISNGRITNGGGRR